MAKAEKPKAKRKPRAKFTDKEQSERFIKAARELGVEETGDAFDTTIKRVSNIRHPNR